MDAQVNATIVIKVLMIMYLFHDEGDFSVTMYTVFIKLHSASMQNTVDFIV